MAGERKGKAYEAVVGAVLNDLLQRGRLTGRVFWNEKPSTLITEPDFTVGQDKDRPLLVLLVTHSGAAHNSHMKFWRNVGEVAEAKTLLARPARVLSVVFDANIKRDLKFLQQECLDGQLIVGDCLYGETLMRWLGKQSSSLPGEKDAVILELRHRIESGPESLREAYRDFKKDVEALVGERNRELEGLWSTVRSREAATLVVARDTRFRRGIAKASLLTDPTVLASRNAREVPQYAFDLGFFRRSIAGATLVDSDLLWVRDHLAVEELTNALQAVPRKQMEVWAQPLRDVERVQRYHEYVTQNWQELVIAEGLLRHFQRTSSARWLSKTFGSAYVPPGWLFEHLRDVLRAHHKRKAAWGWSVLIADLKKFDRDESYRAFVARASGLRKEKLESEWSGYRTVTYAIPEWIMGESRQNFPLKATDLPRVAYTLANRLAQIPRPSLPGLLEKAREYFIWAYLEQKYIPYRRFDPIRLLVERALASAGLPFEYHPRFPTAFTERAEERGAGLTVRSGKTSILLCGSTMIDWQSVTKEGRDHKRKELAGRCVATRMTWSAARSEFMPRPGIRRAVLVADGSWTDADLASLQRAGWDAIVFPDEVDTIAREVIQ